MRAWRGQRLPPVMLAAMTASAGFGTCAAALLYAAMGDPVSALLFGALLSWGVSTSATGLRR